MPSESVRRASVAEAFVWPELMPHASIRYLAFFNRRTGSEACYSTWLTMAGLSAALPLKRIGRIYSSGEAMSCMIRRTRLTVRGEAEGTDTVSAGMQHGIPRAAGRVFGSAGNQRFSVGLFFYFQYVAGAARFCQTRISQSGCRFCLEWLKSNTDFVPKTG